MRSFALQEAWVGWKCSQTSASHQRERNPIKAFSDATVQGRAGPVGKFPLSFRYTLNPRIGTGRVLRGNDYG